MRECEFPGCARTHSAKGLCAAHYLQHWNGEKVRPLRRRSAAKDPAERFWEKVDKKESCWLWTAAKSQSGHGLFRADNRIQFAHRYAWVLTGNPVPESGWFHPSENSRGWMLDHDNPEFGCGNPACVNPAHLEPVPHEVNTRRKRGLNKNNTSGATGVHLLKRTGRWMAECDFHGERHYFGYFDTIEEAEDARAAGIAKLNNAS